MALNTGCGVSSEAKIGSPQAVSWPITNHSGRQSPGPTPASDSPSPATAKPTWPRGTSSDRKSWMPPTPYSTVSMSSVARHSAYQSGVFCTPIMIAAIEDAYCPSEHCGPKTALPVSALSEHSGSRPTSRSRLLARTAVRQSDTSSELRSRKLCTQSSPDTPRRFAGQSSREIDQQCPSRPVHGCAPAVPQRRWDCD
jgi:hypothetical protein